MLKHEMDLNADIGEGYGVYSIGNDLDIMSFVTSVNIACGFHAGDYLTMDKTVKEAVKAGVKIGAHPGYPDRYGFGRRPMVFTHEEIRALLIYQIGAMKSMVECAGGQLNHVKLHGALYHTVADNKKLAQLLAHTIHSIDSNIVLYGLSGSEMISSAIETGLTVKNEVFADRRYTDEGRLVSRTIKGSVLEGEEAVIKQVQSIIEKGQVITESGNILNLKGETICVHGDTPESLSLAKRIHAYLAVARSD